MTRFTFYSLAVLFCLTISVGCDSSAPVQTINEDEKAEAERLALEMEAAALEDEEASAEP